MSCSFNLCLKRAVPFHWCWLRFRQSDPGERASSLLAASHLEVIESPSHPPPPPPPASCSIFSIAIYWQGAVKNCTWACTFNGEGTEELPPLLLFFMPYLTPPPPPSHSSSASVGKMLRRTSPGVCTLFLFTLYLSLFLSLPPSLSLSYFLFVPYPCKLYKGSHFFPFGLLSCYMSFFFGAYFLLPFILHFGTE